ncbi:hypothetical protein P153DRAFT_299770 [Dothidotthia symphoricarpi CBS 119687]|uniref:F-box domain-containing protein n=1 Tax=Dothidotthia symphoricarpi CBS 119687 TaxID=1392245 RepID=A0A6A6A3R7_9PLEO|nr:uncharacterized protein P153DRAFT_299770 [Dothidotthia symphoricarpi CBS 119687]KAF2125557.1 hypothetical protein P153DRAFT_299770 [Dothidotthia symphoricarpi CBS 119687]
MWWWCSGAYVCSADALALFRLIHTLKRVKTLEVMMMRRSVDMFTTAVASTPPQESSVFLMPRVEKLVVTSDAAFLVSQCPNLRDLVIDDRTNCLVGPYCSLPTRLEPLLPNLPSPALTHFDATAHWSVDEVRFLVLRFPALKYLRMRSDTYCYRASISAITSLLGTGLPHLKTLKLVKVGNLDTGYQSVWRRRMKGCSDAVYRKMLWRENEERRVEAENMVVRLAFGEIKGLGECWVGEGRVARRMDAEAWMWERRREDAAECGWDDPWASMAENEGVVVRREMGR